MNKSLTHTFNFTTSLENILFISEEDEKKHFVQYIQYKPLPDLDLIELRYVNVKVDRPYYLEIANVCLDDRERRRRFFSVLGKRRFGANNKYYDYYLLEKSFNTDILEKEYTNFASSRDFTPDHVETTNYSTNEYRVQAILVDDHYFLFLDQINTTQRKKLHKIFCVEISHEDLKFFNTFEKGVQKVNYTFNKIGKRYFQSLEIQKLKLTSSFKSFHELALSKLITSSSAMERSSRVNDNTLFRKLKAKHEEVGRIDKELQERCEALLKNPQNPESIEAFSEALDLFSLHTKDLTALQEMISYFREIQELATSGTISYLLTKKDLDLKDIFLYMLESFSIWNDYLYQKDEDIKSFNIATIDLIDSFRYLVDMCYKFKHEYKCLDAEQEKSEEPITTTLTDDKTVVTSAADFFNDIELDSEVYEELQELEREIDIQLYANEYNEDMNRSLVQFFEGYTSVLNPLFEFKDFSYSLMLLAKKLEEYEIDENAEMLLLLIRGLVSDLLEWKKSVLVDKTAEDIHYMDKSFYSNIAQIEMSLEHREADELFEESDDFEFF